MQTNLIIESKDQSGKKITTTITYLRSGLTSQKVAEFAYALNALTTNNYQSAKREVTEVI